MNACLWGAVVASVASLYDASCVSEEVNGERSKRSTLAGFAEISRSYCSVLLHSSQLVAHWQSLQLDFRASQNSWDPLNVSKITVRNRHPCLIEGTCHGSQNHTFLAIAVRRPHAGCTFRHRIHGISPKHTSASGATFSVVFVIAPLFPTGIRLVNTYFRTQIWTWLKSTFPFFMVELPHQTQQGTFSQNRSFNPSHCCMTIPYHLDTLLLHALQTLPFTLLTLPSAKFKRLSRVDCHYIIYNNIEWSPFFNWTIVGTIRTLKNLLICALQMYLPVRTLIVLSPFLFTIQIQISANISGAEWQWPGGAGILIHKTVSYFPILHETVLHAVSVRLDLCIDHTVCSVYLVLSCDFTKADFNALFRQLTPPVVILGYFNLTHPLWDDSVTSAKAQILVNFLDPFSFIGSCDRAEWPPFYKATPIPLSPSMKSLSTDNAFKFFYRVIISATETCIP